MNYKEELLNHIDEIHTTELGVQRIQKNLKIEEDPVKYCIDLIKDEKSDVSKNGKNFYVNIKNKEITVNSSSFTIITAHLKKNKS